MSPLVRLLLKFADDFAAADAAGRPLEITPNQAAIFRAAFTEAAAHVGRLEIAGRERDELLAIATDLDVIDRVKARSGVEVGGLLDIAADMRRADRRAGARAAAAPFGDTNVVSFPVAPRARPSTPNNGDAA